MTVRKKKTTAKRKVAATAKRKTSRAKKKPVGHKVARAPAKKKPISRRPPGFSTTPGGILVPNESATPIPASKLRVGFSKAKDEINSIIEDIISTMKDDYVISEIELAASFSADGKFMGFGVGGAATITIRISPHSE